MNRSIFAGHHVAFEKSCLLLYTVQREGTKSKIPQTDLREP